MLEESDIVESMKDVRIRTNEICDWELSTAVY